MFSLVGVQLPLHFPPQVVIGSLNAQAYVNILQKTLGKDYNKGNVLIQDWATSITFCYKMA